MDPTEDCMTKYVDPAGIPRDCHTRAASVPLKGN